MPFAPQDRRTCGAPTDALSGAELAVKAVQVSAAVPSSASALHCISAPESGATSAILVDLHRRPGGHLSGLRLGAREPRRKPIGAPVNAGQSTLDQRRAECENRHVGCGRAAHLEGLRGRNGVYNASAASPERIVPAA
jgi:hypothetical protein